jgi:Spy/CpxP family protein refolding chaperone
MRGNWKTWTLCAAFALGAGSLALAQEPARHGRGGQRQSVETRVNRMREQLNLSDEQARRIEAILNDAAARPADGSNREDRMAQRQQVRQRIDEVLTPEQRQQRDQIAAQRGQRGKGGQGGQRGQGGQGGQSGRRVR